MSMTNQRPIRSIHGAFDHACASLGNVYAGMGENEVTLRLNRDLKARDALVRAMSDMGLNKLINLTTCYDDARISLVFYAGDGVVAKVIPQNYFDDSNPIHSLPPVTMQKIDAGEFTGQGFIIATYPYLTDAYIPESRFKQHEAYMNEFGLTADKNETDIRNFRLLTDAAGTITTIDAQVYMSAHNGNTLPQKTRDAWREYLSLMYPMYKSGVIPAQSDKTDFSFRSFHDRTVNLQGFDARRPDPIITAPQANKKKDAGFWNFLFPKDDDPAPSL